MTWKQQIEAQIAWMSELESQWRDKAKKWRDTKLSPSKVNDAANMMVEIIKAHQDMLDVAVAADRTVQARHEQSPCEEIKAYYDMSDALDKLREVSDE